MQGNLEMPHSRKQLLSLGLAGCREKVSSLSRIQKLGSLAGAKTLAGTTPGRSWELRERDGPWATRNYKELHCENRVRGQR